MGHDGVAEFLREKGAFFMSKDDLDQPILGDRKVLFSGLKYVLRQVCTAFPSLELGEVFTPCKHSATLLPCSVWYTSVTATAKNKRRSGRGLLCKIQMI